MSAVLKLDGLACTRQPCIGTLMQCTEVRVALWYGGGLLPILSVAKAESSAAFLAQVLHAEPGWRMTFTTLIKGHIFEVSYIAQGGKCTEVVVSGEAC
eukprot:scaffold57263_cov18-Tisochrysis_lutea.AAC.2